MNSLQIPGKTLEDMLYKRLYDIAHFYYVKYDEVDTQALWDVIERRQYYRVYICEGHED